MTISENAWSAYVAKLATLSGAASDAVQKFLATGVDVSTKDGKRLLLDLAYALAQRYGLAAAELACEMYDAIAAASGLALPAAMPAALPEYGDVARAVNGAMKTSALDDVIGAAVGRQVKLSGQDTTLQNAIRDGAEFAWIPHGDTCAYCIMLASRGWQRASKEILKNGHAEHIHGNCDCAYMVRFKPDTNVRGYDPARYRKMYDDAPGRDWRDKLNAMRREFYAENKDEINAQKRDAYEKRQELNSPSAEEKDV